MGRLHLASVRLDLPIATDHDLCDIDRIVMEFGESQRYCDRVALCASFDLIHLWGVKRDGVLDVCHIHGDVEETAPSTSLNKQEGLPRE